MMLVLKLQYFGHFMQSWLTGKDSVAGRDWGQEEKGTTEDEMAGWHHWLNGHDFEQAWELVIDREASRAAAHGVTKLDTTEQLWSNLAAAAAAAEQLKRTTKYPTV